MELESSFIQIPGIGKRTEQKLWSQGITDWHTGASASVLGPTKRRKLALFANEAETELAAGNIEYFAGALPNRARWRLAETFRDQATALDIETTGLEPTTNQVTTVSLHGPAGTRTLIQGQDLTADRLQAELDRSGMLVTYNGARFDIPFLEKRFNLDIDQPHLDLMYDCQRLGWTGGLKTVEEILGIERSVPDVDGLEAVRLWHRYQDGDEHALDRLVEYNREDTRTLLPIMDQITAALDQEVFEPHLA